MTVDWSLVVAGVALASSGCCLVLIARQRANSAKETNQLRGEMFAQSMAGATQFDGLKLQIEQLEESMQNTDELLQDGRLNRSARARAFELLRSGVAPETAASRLGMARREMNLLARVAEALTPYR